MAVQRLEQFNPEISDPLEHLVSLFKKASDDIFEKVRENAQFSGMGTTLTAAFLRDGLVYWAHVGDSRIYLYQEGELKRITWDHTLPDTLLKEGDITEEEARNHPAQHLLLQCVGCGRFKASTGIFRLKAGNLLLLTSDGLHHEVSEEEIFRVLQGREGLEKKLVALTQEALKLGGRDNITVVGAQN